MRLASDIEEKLKSKALKYLAKSRPEWDIPHTLASVNWIKKLIEAEGGNEKILVSAMYLHDIGYAFLKKGETVKQTMSVKTEHMSFGGREAKKILSKLDYSSDEIEKIVHLVETHDKLDKLNSVEEIMIMEADSLAQIDIDRVKPNYTKNEYSKYIEEHFKPERIPKFKTNAGKKFLKELLVKLEKYLA